MATYVIGEIGQNHNGSMELAKNIIELATTQPRDELFGLELPGMDAVKFTKRDLANELSTSAAHARYDSPHAFGSTYAEHRAHLELSNEQHFELYRYATTRGLEFVETLCGIGCLSILDLFTPHRLKVASRDLTNLPLLVELAKTQIPIILSTGMADKILLDEALEVVTRYHEQITILHCLSEYPSRHEHLNLLSIQYLRDNYSQYEIGYSDHSVGILMPALAVGLGAQVIEKHITLDRTLKGADQMGSLGPDGVRRMMRDIRLAEVALGERKLQRHGASETAARKLERSVATTQDITKGTHLLPKHIHLLSPGTGIKWRNRHQILGKRLLVDLPKNEIISLDMLEDDDQG